MQEMFPLALSFDRIMPFTIPIVAIVGAFTVGIVAMYLKSKENERIQKERMFLAEKGLEIPKELYGTTPSEKKPVEFHGARAWLLVLGAIALFIGIGVMIFLGVQEGIREGMVGIIPISIGVSFLVAERLIVRLVVRAKRQEL